MVLIILFSLIILSLYKREKMTYKKTALIIFIAGIIIRFVYITTNSIFDYENDLGNWEKYYGHLGYIRHILEYWTLPDIIKLENPIVYHPPLFHFLCAIWLKIALCFTNITIALESLQFFTLIINILTIKTILDIISSLKIKNIYLLLLINFLPITIIFSGFINNDTLLILLTFLAIKYFIKWTEKLDFKNIIIIAICCALAMNTKYSILILVATFAISGISILNKSNYKNLLKQYLTFGLIFICGCWFNFYTFINGQGLLLMITPDKNFVKKLTINFTDIFMLNFNDFVSPFFYADNTHNLYTSNYITSLIKTFLYGEKEYNNYTIICYILFVVIFIYLIISVIKTIRLKEKNTIISFIKNYILLGFFMHFYYIYQSPFLCTLNARYVLPQIFLLIIISYVPKRKK